MPPGCFFLRRAARRRGTHSSSSGGREIRFRRAAPPGPAGGGEGSSELSASHLSSNSAQKSSIKRGGVTEPRAAVRAQKWSLKTPQTSGGQWGVGGTTRGPGGGSWWSECLEKLSPRAPGGDKILRVYQGAGAAQGPWNLSGIRDNTCVCVSEHFHVAFRLVFPPIIKISLVARWCFLSVSAKSLSVNLICFWF